MTIKGSVFTRRQGVRFQPSLTWNDAIRSWKVFNSCNYSAAWEHINWGGFCKKYYGQVPNASAMDAEISSMWVSKGSWAWTLCG